MNKVTQNFCVVCGDDREFRHERQPTGFEVRGETIILDLPVKVCRTCGTIEAEQGVDPTEMAFAEYRERKGLLTPEQIKRIRKRYRLSQKSLAALLGMSEATVNRYEGGGPQDLAHDNLLRSCEAPEVVRRLVDRNGDKLSKWQRQRVEEVLAGTGRKRRERVLDASKSWKMPDEVSATTGFRRFSHERYAAVVVWLCRHLPKVTMTSSHKYLFYTDFLHFKSEAISLTGAAYRQMKYGPVPAASGDLQQFMECHGCIEVQEVQYANGNTGFEFSPGPRADELDVTFTPRELKVLTMVDRELRGLTPSQLSERSHRETAYRETPRLELISYDKAAELSLPVPE